MKCWKKLKKCWKKKDLSIQNSAAAKILLKNKEKIDVFLYKQKLREFIMIDLNY